jgi:hypothetical protein
MHRFAIAALLALGLASSAFAAAPVGPFKLDAKGACHAANGQFAKKSFCTAAPVTNHCRDPKTKKFTKCSAPGSVPA